MSWSYLVAGLVLGVILFGGVLFVTGQDVDADALCSERFGEDWESKSMNKQLPVGNQTARLTCTNGTATENISVLVNAEAEL